MLYDLKSYIDHHQRVSLNDIATHFDMDPLAVESALSLWVQKGQIGRTHYDRCAGACQGCMEVCQMGQWVFYYALKSSISENLQAVTL